VRIAYLVSLWLGAILLVPSGAHVLEMSRKLLMDRDSYFISQQIYLGWAWFGVPIVLKIGLDTVLGFALRRSNRLAAHAALASATLIAVGLVVFFIWVEPANTATSNWASRPDNWQTLRQSWEYGHLAIAGCTALAFGFISYGATGLGAPEY
jgi:hypothetical protein